MHRIVFFIHEQKKLEETIHKLMRKRVICLLSLTRVKVVFSLKSVKVVFSLVRAPVW